MHASRVVMPATLMFLLAGCASPGPTAPANQASPPAAAERVLTASIAVEPTYVAAFAPLPPGGASDFYQRMFNAFLELYDDQARIEHALVEVARPSRGQRQI